MATVSQYLSEIDLPLPRRVVFGGVDYAPGGSLGPRRQADVQLVVLDRGSLRLTTDGVERRLGPGGLALQWPGGREHYAFDAAAASAHRWVALTFDAEASTGDKLAALRRRARPVANETAAMATLFGAARALQDDAPPPTALVALGLAYLAAALPAELSAAPDAAAGGGARPRLPTPLIRMQAAIADRFDTPLTLDDLAAAASVTRHHLARLCRRHLDATPMGLLWDRRVGHGLELLRDTGLSVSEIAYRVGFASPFHFSRRVKQKTGVPPRDFRQQAWAAE